MKICAKAMSALIDLYRHFHAQAIQAISEDAASAVQDLEVSFLLLKVLSKLVIYGWGGAATIVPEEQVARDALCEQQKVFCVSIVTDFENIQAVRRGKVLAGHFADGPYLANLNKHVAAYLKFYRALLMNNHLEFHALGITQQLCQILWSNISEGAHDLATAVSDENPAVLLPEKYYVNNILFVKMCFVQWPYAMSTWKDADFAVQAVDLIVSKLLPLRPADLERWEEEPEEWFKEEQEERWQFDLRVSPILHTEVGHR